MRLLPSTIFTLLLSAACKFAYAYYDVSLPLPDQATSLETWFTNGNFQLKFRPRFESVYNNAYALFQTQPQHNARATTLSSRLHYTTAQYSCLFGVLDFNNVTAYLHSQYNSGDNTNPSKQNYALIPDPEGTAVIQSYLAFEGLPNTILIGGRQIIRLDNERFVGPSSFRQMPQTFDAILFFNDTLNNVEWFYAFIGQVNTIWQGNTNAQFGQRKNTTHLVNVSSDLKPFGNLIAYGYFIHDFDIASFSTQTLGLRYLNEMEFSYFDAYLKIEYARQNNLANNPLDYRANYFHGVLGFVVSIFDLSAGYEMLAGDDRTPGKAFQTPLGSQHIFNGLAEQFVIIPNAGLRDLYGVCELNFWNITLFGQYHHFRAQTNSNSYGDEWDAGVSYNFLKHYCISLEYADFSGNPVMGYSDVRKAWVTFLAQF